MRIVNDIVYPDKANEFLKVSEIRVLSDYLLWLRFNTGEIKTFDFASLLDKPAYMPLRERDLFVDVRLDHGNPTWQNGDIDIAPEYLYEYGQIA